MGTKKQNLYQAWVYGRKEKLRKLTPDQIIGDLKRDIDCGREWSISPSELIEIISKPGFPESKGNEIKILIITYHANRLEENSPFGEDLSLFITTHCYYTVGSVGQYAKSRLRKAFLDSSLRDPLSRLPETENITSSQIKDWTVDCLGNFHRYFGPDPARWSQKIRRRFEHDFLKTGN